MLITQNQRITRAKIKQVRQELNLSYKTLGELFSLPESVIEQWESEAPPADACGAIQLALKQLQIEKIMDERDIIRTLDERLAELDERFAEVQKLRAQLNSKRVEFEPMFKGGHEVRKIGKQGREKRDTIRWADNENLTTVSAKAPDYVAGHWAVEAKRTRISMSYIINKALIEAFGVPEGALADPDIDGDAGN